MSRVLLPDPTPEPFLVNTTVSLWYKILKDFGPITVLAGVLMYFFIVEFRAEVRTSSSAAIQASGLVRSHIEATHAMNAELLWYMRVNCLHNARSEEQRQQCVPPKALVQGLLLESVIQK